MIRDADKKDLYELAEELGSLSRAARDGKLKVDQLQGATFTISSLGGIGGTAFTPIINAPKLRSLGGFALIDAACLERFRVRAAADVAVVAVLRPSCD